MAVKSFCACVCHQLLSDAKSHKLHAWYVLSCLLSCCLCYLRACLLAYLTICCALLACLHANVLACTLADGWQGYEELGIL